MIYRKAEVKDAENFLEMTLALDQETKFMIFEPNERSKDINRLKDKIQQTIQANDLLLVAEINHKIVGFLSAQRGVPNRIKHSAYIVIGIRASFQNQGIGSQLFRELDLWAKQNDITRLELTVVCQNTAAKHLYEKYGFVIEGTKRNSMIVDGKYVDEYYMGKLL